MDSWSVIRPGWADLISILTICGRFLLKPRERLDRDKLTAPLLIIGGWFSILCSLNKLTLLGLGAPRYGAIAYSVTGPLASLLVHLGSLVDHPDAPSYEMQ